MTIVPMCKVSMVTMERERESVIARLQDAGVLHIVPAKNRSVSNLDDGEIARTEIFIGRLEGAINVLKRFFGSPAAIPPRQLAPAQILERVVSIADQHKQCEQAIARFMTEIEKYSPFGEFHEQAQTLQSLGLNVKLAQVDRSELATLKRNGIIHEVVKCSGSINYVVMFLKDGEEPGCPCFDPPARSLKAIRDDIEEAARYLGKLESEAAHWSYQVRVVEKARADALLRLDRLLELKKASIRGDLIGIHGFIVKTDAEVLKRALSDQLVAFSIEEVSQNDDVPVKLRNFRAIQGFAAIVRMFTGINYFEKDRIAVAAFFAIVFGSLCLLDAGYGFILLVIGYVGAIKKDRELGQVCMWIGLATIILGILNGKIFGMVFARDIMLNIPPLFSLITDPKACLKFSLLVGLIAMSVTNFMLVALRGFRSPALGSLIAIASIFMMVISESQIFEGRFFDPSVILAEIAAGLGVLSLIAWMIFPEPMFGPQKRVVNALWMIYAGPSFLLRDVLSHVRLFAVAMSVSILALVINKICAICPLLLGLVLAPLGHFAVFGLSLLLVFLESNRLIFVEIGSKCMRGGSSYFQPFVRRTYL